LDKRLSRNFSAGLHYTRHLLTASEVFNPSSVAVAQDSFNRADQSAFEHDRPHRFTGNFAFENSVLKQEAVSFSVALWRFQITCFSLRYGAQFICL